MADRYWVGGTGNWSDTAHWSATSGGASGASVPTSADNAIFNAASNATAYTVTVNATANCLDLNFAAAPSVSGTITFTGSSALSINGNVTLLSGMTYTMSSVTLNAASGIKTITSNGVGFTGTKAFAGAGTWQLADNLTISSGSSSLAAGTTFDPNGKDVLITYAAGAISMSGAWTFYNFTRSSASGNSAELWVTGSLTVTGTFTVSGSAANARILVKGGTLGTAATITAAAVSLSNVDFMDITGAGAAAPFTGTSLGDCLGNSGITFDAAQTQYWKTTTTGTKTWSTAANWFLGSNGTGGAGRVPLPQDNVVFDSASIGAASTTVSADMPRLGKDITWTGVANNPTFTAAAGITSYGSVTLSSGIGSFSHARWSMCGRSSHTITCAGKVFGNVAMLGIGGTYTLQDAFSGVNVQLAAGTFDAATYNVTVQTTGNVGASYASTVKLGTGVWTITGANVNGDTPYAWQAGASMTLVPGSATIKFTDATANAKTFNGGGKTYNNIWISGAGSGAYNFIGSNTFADFKISDGAKTIKFTAGTTTTIASATGFEDNAATISSITSATHTLAKSGGGTVKMRGATVSYSIASPAATFYAGATGTDGGNNTNWTFNNAPATADAALTEGTATLTAAGTVAIAAAAEVSEGAATLASTAANAIAASAAVDEGAATLEATAANAIAAAAALDEGAATLDAAAANAIAASAELDEGASSLVFAGVRWTIASDSRYVCRLPRRNFTAAET